MTKISKLLSFAGMALITGLSLSSCTSEPKKPEQDIKEEKVTYQVDSTQFDGYVAYDANVQGKRPAILVLPEWWGLTEYPRKRAKELAALGYVAMAMDFYGNGKIAPNPDSAGKWATPFYQNPEMAKARFDAALAVLKNKEQVDASHIAAIGYCFGGGMALNMARLGENLDAVVSFHGNLAGVPANKDLLKAKILVCHGADDQFVKPEEVEQFKHQMDSIGANYTVKVYPNATHAFTNPDATKMGQEYNMPIAYNPAADTASWNDMKSFFEKAFPVKPAQ
jgi:dienelactone hydrolase